MTPTPTALRCAVCGCPIGPCPIWLAPAPDQSSAWSIHLHLRDCVAALRRHAQRPPEETHHA